ncbi:hypothetical protein [Salinibaculum rarum]|jgi:hypothetical protein|uniref:hypothetical protein n=1 Tax=Salinibaculum rarum TaxID=3058903 RepID=UPI00265DB776|nr:hypothetical protein [Salinibaculum sp. KK48]
MSRRPVSLPRRTELPARSLVSGLRRVAFWAAVVLPLAYLPLLSSPVDDTQLLVFVALATLNVVCLFIGHDYSR